MRFFDVGVYRDDVLGVLNDLKDASAPVKTLCDSPRKNELNEQGYAAIMNTYGLIAEVIAAPKVTHEETDDFGEKPSSPGPSVAIGS